MAEKRGELKPGGTIIEATSGNTGGPRHDRRGARLQVHLRDARQDEPREDAALRAFGAKVVVCPTAVEPEDPRSYYSVAKRLAIETPNSFYANQYHNLDNPEATTSRRGPRSGRRPKARSTCFVAGLGTGGTITGTGATSRRRSRGLQLVGVDPVGSLYYDFVQERAASPSPSATRSRASARTSSRAPSISRSSTRSCASTTRSASSRRATWCASRASTSAGQRRRRGRRAQVRTQPDRRRRTSCRARPTARQVPLQDLQRRLDARERLPRGRRPRHRRDLLKHKSDEIIAARPADRVRDVIARMKAHGISQLPVVEEGKLLGAVAEVDLLRYLVSTASTRSISAVGLARRERLRSRSRRARASRTSRACSGRPDARMADRARRLRRSRASSRRSTSSTTSPSPPPGR
jgi:cystathionine beta-synthase